MLRYYALIKKSSKYAVLEDKKMYVCMYVCSYRSTSSIHYSLEVIKLILILNCIALVERLRSCYSMA